MSVTSWAEVSHCVCNQIKGLLSAACWVIDFTSLLIIFSQCGVMFVWKEFSGRNKFLELYSFTLTSHFCCSNSHKPQKHYVMFFKFSYVCLIQKIIRVLSHRFSLRSPVESSAACFKSLRPSSINRYSQQVLTFLNFNVAMFEED